MKKRVVLRAIGEVQKVGYRDFVQKMARKLGIVGHVENMRDGSVQIVCEGEEAVIGEFQKAINVKIDFIDVNEVKIIETKKATGEFEYFDIKYGSSEEELGDRMGAGILYMAATRDEVRCVKDEVKSSRQDIQAMHTDLKGGFKETKECLTEVKNEMKSGFNNVESAVSSMHTDMNTRFDTLDTKYGEIGEKMTKLEHNIGDLTWQIKRLVDHVVGEDEKKHSE